VALYAGAGRDLLEWGAAAPKPVDVASLAAPQQLAGRPSVAVLPFKNLSGDAGQDFFSAGITEDVITALGRFSNLLVVAKSASFQVNRNLSPPEIGRQLNILYLLDGSVRRAGDRPYPGLKVLFALIAPMPERHFFSVRPFIFLASTASPSKPLTVPSLELSDLTLRLLDGLFWPPPTRSWIDERTPSENGTR